MTTPLTPPVAPAERSLRAPRRAFRDTEASVIGGVASGVARHLAVPVLAVRAAFVLTALLGGLGVALYAGLWLFLPAAAPFEHSTPGGESASRGGRRPPRIGRVIDKGPAIALVVLGFGGVLLLESALGSWLFWPVLLGVIGVALLWRQADEAQRERWLDTTGRFDPVRMLFGRGGWAAYARVAAGLVLLVGSFGLFTLRGGSVSDARDLMLAFVVGIGGIAVVVGPWVHRLLTDLAVERAERVRTQERADVAAHLHDSVLQTLALIQRNADDPITVARLARAQERDLRSWLYEDPGTPASTFAAALRGALVEVEDAHGAVVDVVVVGDAALDQWAVPVVAAAREAATNAAKHAGTGRVDVYAEVTPDAIEVFVRDRGRGFVVDDIPRDRHGVRDSIVARMERHGGHAEVRSTPDQGTEVRLRQPRQPAGEEGR